MLKLMVDYLGEACTVVGSLSSELQREDQPFPKVAAVLGGASQL